MRIHKHTSPTTTGFTMIEILVALAITVLVSTAVLGLSFQLFRLYAGINGNAKMQTEANNIINQMRDDLRWGKLGDDSDFSFTVTKATSESTEKILYTYTSYEIKRNGTALNAPGTIVRNFTVDSSISTPKLLKINFELETSGAPKRRHFEFYLSEKNF